MRNRIILPLISIFFIFTCFTACSEKVELEYEAPPYSVKVDRRDQLMRIRLEHVEQILEYDFDKEATDAEFENLVRKTKGVLESGREQVSKAIPNIKRRISDGFRRFNVWKSASI